MTTIFHVHENFMKNFLQILRLHGNFMRKISTIWRNHVGIIYHLQHNYSYNYNGCDGKIFFVLSMIGLIVASIIDVVISKNKSIIIISIIISSFLLTCYAVCNSINLHKIENNVVNFKPIIYLYPEETTKVNVTLGNPKLLTHTYPKYNENIGWNVIAEPTGNLKYLNNDKEQNLYALYWEGNSAKDKKIEDDGFIVKGEDTIEFLEEKLALLGLNEREAEEFIVYWLPQMEDNKYNYIRFETSNEIEENMPLNISPKPDTTIRIMMDWCEINSESEADRLSHNIKEQELTTPERDGFVVVEWGGSKIK